MPRLSEYMILSQKEQPVLMVPVKTNVNDLIRDVNESRKKIERYLADIKEDRLTDVPFVTYLNGDIMNLEIEVCYPTHKPLMGNDEISFSSIPASKIVACMLSGDSEERRKIYEDMMSWIDDNGYEYGGSTYEYFYFDNRNPGECVLTKILRTVK